MSDKKTHNVTVKGVNMTLPERSKTVAVILLVLFGLGGWHNLYIRKPMTMALQFLCTCLVITMPVTLVWIIIDLVNIIKADKDGYGVPYEVTAK